jgi:hypothetical protein
MSFDEPDGYLDDIAETRVTETSPELSGGEPLPSRASTSSVAAEGPSSPWRERTKRTLRFTRTMLVTALVLAGLGALGNIAIHHLPRTTTHTYTYSNIHRVLIAVDGNGSVDVHGVDSDQVTLHAKDTATLLEPVQRQIISSGGWLIVSVHCPSSECTSRYNVDVPREASVHVILDHSTDQSDISVQNVTSAVELYAGHGGVTVNNVSANVSIVANGRVQATAISAPVDVFAPIGDKIAIQITGSPQSVNVNSGQDAQVSLTVPQGGYGISCVPTGACKAPDGTSLDSGGLVRNDPTAEKKIQINVHPPTVAHIGAG